MSQKVQIYRNTSVGTKASGKYYVRAVYDEKFITTEELADFIQQQATVKKSDCKAVLDELGSAMRHYFKLGQKIRIDNIGIFKVAVSSSGSDTLTACGAASVKSSRVLFQPEIETVPSGETHEVERAVLVDGVPTKVTYNVTSFKRNPVMLKDVRFELAQGTLGNGIEPDGEDDNGEKNP